MPIGVYTRTAEMRKHISEGHKGQVAWNRGLRTGIVPKMAFKKGDPRITGPANHRWNGGVPKPRKSASGSKLVGLRRGPTKIKTDLELLERKRFRNPTVDGTPAASPSAPSAGTIQSAVGASNPYFVIANVLVNSGATAPTSIDQSIMPVASFAFTKLSGFSAYASAGNYSIPNNTWTKLQLNTETYDIAGEFDPTTNYRFTATTAGKYLVTATAQISALTTGHKFSIAIYKNGSAYKADGAQSANFSVTNATITAIIDLAATDYIEIFVLHAEGSALDVQGGISTTYAAGQRLA